MNIVIIWAKCVDPDDIKLQYFMSVRESALFAKTPNYVFPMRKFRNFCQRGSNFDFFLFFSWWEERWWPNIKFWFGSFVIFQGIRTSIVKEPYIFVIFQVGLDPLSPSPSPSGSAHVFSTQRACFLTSKFYVNFNRKAVKIFHVILYMYIQMVQHSFSKMNIWEFILVK